MATETIFKIKKAIWAFKAKSNQEIPFLCTENGVFESKETCPSDAALSSIYLDLPQNVQNHCVTCLKIAVWRQMKIPWFDLVRLTFPRNAGSPKNIFEWECDVCESPDYWVATEPSGFVKVRSPEFSKKDPLAKLRTLGE
jgi:hypothetical protein